jgi:hypothetical protein
VFLLPLLTIYYNRKRLHLKLIGITFIPLLFVLFTLHWNEQRTGLKQYSSISTINLLHYNAYTLLIHEKGVKKADSIIDDISFQASQKISYKEQQQFKNNAAKTLIFSELGPYIYLHMRGAILCILDPGRFNSFINPLGLLLMGLLICNFIKLIIAIRFIFLKGVNIANKFLLLLFPIYILILTGPIGSSRFAMPIIPIYLGIILISLSVKKNEINN